MNQTCDALDGFPCFSVPHRFILTQHVLAISQGQHQRHNSAEDREVHKGLQFHSEVGASSSVGSGSAFTVLAMRTSKLGRALRLGQTSLWQPVHCVSGSMR